MSITAKPADYTVNTGHAKCPHHLWMLDEGSGTTLNDIGSVGGLDMTLQNADMWDTDTGDLDSPIIQCNSSTNRYARRTGYTPSSSSALWLAIGKPNSATIGGASEALLSTAIYDAASVTTGQIGFVATTGVPQLTYDYGTNASGNQSWGTDLYDTVWAMIAGMVRGSDGGTRVIKKLSANGAAWQNSSAYSGYIFPNDAGGVAPNAIGIGCRPAQTVNNIFNGAILAVMAWDDFDWATVDDTWIASLYSDPWQFLDTSAGSPLILPQRSSGGMLDLSGNFRG